MKIAELVAERERFADVMKARRSDKELLELFHKLVLSDKFSDEAKPYCYADLVVEASSRLAKSNLAQLQEILQARSVAKKVWLGTAEDVAQKAMAVLLARLFSNTPMIAKPLLELFLWSERAGISIDRGQTMCLALEGGVDMAAMDEIHDLTFYEYYPGIPRPVELAAA